MSLTSKGSTEILVAGWQDKMFVIDLIKGEVVKRVGSRFPDACCFTSLTSPRVTFGSCRPTTTTLS